MIAYNSPITNKPKVIVCGIQEIEEMNWKIIDNVFCISITSSDNNKKTKIQSIPEENILRLQFDDIDTVTEGNDAYTFFINKKYKLFNYDFARQILDFVFNKMKFAIDSNNIMLVHCTMGYSRSPAIAAAICKIIFDDDNLYFSTCCPNMLVYNVILEQYYGPMITMK